MKHFGICKTYKKFTQRCNERNDRKQFYLTDPISVSFANFAGFARKPKRFTQWRNERSDRKHLSFTVLITFFFAIFSRITNYLLVTTAKQLLASFEFNSTIFPPLTDSFPPHSAVSVLIQRTTNLLPCRLRSSFTFPPSGK